jgi:plasmid stability protein
MPGVDSAVNRGTALAALSRRVCAAVYLHTELPMPDLMIPDVPQEELDALTARAERHGRSLEDEARHLLHEAAAEEMLVAELERATRAAEEKMLAASQPAAAGVAAPGRRRVRYEPTPRRR